MENDELLPDTLEGDAELLEDSSSQIKLRRLNELRLKGYSAAEIQEKLDVSIKSVDRKIKILEIKEANIGVGTRAEQKRVELDLQYLQLMKMSHELIQDIDDSENPDVEHKAAIIKNIQGIIQARAKLWGLEGGKDSPNIGKVQAINNAYFLGGGGKSFSRQKLHMIADVIAGKVEFESTGLINEEDITDI